MSTSSEKCTPEYGHHQHHQVLGQFGTQKIWHRTSTIWYHRSKGGQFCTRQFCTNIIKQTIRHQHYERYNLGPHFFIIFHQNCHQKIFLLFCLPQRRYQFHFKLMASKVQLKLLSDPSPIIVYPCQQLTNSVTFSRLDWCDPCVWICQLKTCWGCNCWWCWCWGSFWQQFVTDLEADVWS